MRHLKLSKGNGKYREIFAPDGPEKRAYQQLLPALQRAERATALAQGTESVAHGFVTGRSPVTMALPHRGHAVTISADLASWFDSVRPEQIRAGLELAGADISLADRVCYRGAPRQGLPTSPTAANLAAVTMDRAIIDALQSLGVEYVYTRYADDLAVSLRSPEPRLVAQVIEILAACAQAMGWVVAAHKTRVQYARAGRRVICGVSVDSDVRPPREMRRKLRAAQHHAPISRQSMGLAEWCRMRLPKEQRGSRIIRGAQASVASPVPTPASEASTVLAGSRRIRHRGE